MPLSNQRYALNAANARWGSLYDALYGTDAIPETDGAEDRSAFNPVRGAAVIAYARKFLDEAAPLANGSHADATRYSVGRRQAGRHAEGRHTTGLATPAQFVGYQGDASAPSAVLLKHNGLHFEIQIDANDSDRQDRRGACEGRGDRSGGEHDHRLRRLGRGRRCR